MHPRLLLAESAWNEVGSGRKLVLSSDNPTLRQVSEEQVREELKTITENLTSDDARQAMMELKKWVGEITVAGQGPVFGELAARQAR